MNSLLTVFTPTHVEETSFAEITACIESFQKKVSGAMDYKHLIICDSDSSKGEMVGDYIYYLKEIEKLHPNVEVIHRPNSGCRKNYLYALNKIETPYMFYLEHDWTFLEELNLSKLVSVFEKHSQVNYIRFNHKNNDDISGWDTVHELDTSITEVPLLKVDCWHNVIHMIRVKDYKATKLPLIDSWSIEDSLTRHYKRTIMECGFSEAHSKWGAYLYGKEDATPVVLNIGVREDGNSIGHRVLQFRDAL